MKRLLLLFFAATALCFGMSDQEFFTRAEKWATVFGFKGADGYPYMLKQVTFPQLRVVTTEPCFAVSWWNRQGHIFVALILGDEGLDQMADFYKMPRMTKEEKRAMQETAIVHELVHGIGVDDEAATQMLGNLIARGSAENTPIPESWWNKHLEDPPEAAGVPEKEQ